jgi:hypothetical protein
MINNKQWRERTEPIAESTEARCGIAAADDAAAALCLDHAMIDCVMKHIPWFSLTWKSRIRLGVSSPALARYLGQGGTILSQDGDGCLG